MGKNNHGFGALLSPNALMLFAASLLCAVVLQFGSRPVAAKAVYAEEKQTQPVALSAVPSAAAKESDTIRADGSDMELPTESGMTVTVDADGRSCTVEMYRGTVTDALAKAGITLSDEDECTPARDILLTDGLTVSVTRVAHEETTRTEEVAFQTVKKYDDSLLKGETVVEQEGVVGVRTIVTRRTLVNGSLTEEETLRDEVTTQPVDRIVRIGTRVLSSMWVEPQMSAIDLAGQAAAIGTSYRPGSASWRASVNGDGTITDQYGNTVAYQSVISGRATAYYAPEGAGTATGRLASYGVVAVNPNVIPYGTELFICSADGSLVYGYAIAGDTGGTLMAGTVLVDLYYNTYDQCCWFGSKKMNVYVLK